MSQSNDGTLYFDMPSFLINEVILPLYQLADVTYKMVPQLADEKPFVEVNKNLTERMKTEVCEDVFRMNYFECVAVCQTMSLIKFFCNEVVLPNTEKKEDLTEMEQETKEMYIAAMEHVIDITDNIFVVFPVIKDIFYQGEIAAKKKKEEEKSLGLNKTKKILYISLANTNIEHHVTTLFSFFDYFIFNCTSSFSKRVRESAFCCITEVREVRELIKKAVKATKRNKKLNAELSLRDVVVLLMINNIFQKAYFSDGGDELHELFAGSITKGQDVTAEEVRDHMFKIAKGLEEEMCKLADAMVGFKEAMKPIFEFPIEEAI